MSTSKTVRGSDAHNFSVVPSAELPARVAQDCQLNKADAKDLSAQSSTLTDAEALELSSLEAKVERSLKAFWEIGQALRQIRDRRLYRQDFSTFEDYCTNRWEMSRRWAYQLIEAATVYENVRHGAQILPANERQVRPLTALPSQEQPRASLKPFLLLRTANLRLFTLPELLKNTRKKFRGISLTTRTVPKTNELFRPIIHRQTVKFQQPLKRMLRDWEQHPVRQKLNAEAAGTAIIAVLSLFKTTLTVFIATS